MKVVVSRHCDPKLGLNDKTAYRGQHDASFLKKKRKEPTERGKVNK